MEKLDPPPPARPASLAPEAVRVAVNRCPFCRDDVAAEEGHVCRDCLTRHHPACWEEGAGCSSCRSEHLLRPQPQPISDDLVRDLLDAQGSSAAEIDLDLARADASPGCAWRLRRCDAAGTHRVAFSRNPFCWSHARFSQRVVAAVMAFAALMLAISAAALAVVAPEEGWSLLLVASVSAAAAIGVGVGAHAIVRGGPRGRSPGAEV